MADAIGSSGNARIKLVRKLATRRGREREGAFAVEGEDLVGAGIEHGWTPRFVLVSEEAGAAAAQLPAQLVVPVSARVMDELSSLGHAARVVGVFDRPQPDAPREEPGSGATVWLDGIKDPGNVGTILRTAHALGVEEVWLGAGTADPFSPKATRASMGSLFAVRLAAVPDKVAGRMVVALDPGASERLASVELGPSPVIVLGAERDGLSERGRSAATRVVSIPQAPGADSLNVAASGAIALYEWRRQLEVVG